MTNVYDMSPDASDDEDFAPLPTEEFEPFVDLQTLLTRPAHLSIFLNYAIGENKPNNLVGESFLVLIGIFFRFFSISNSMKYGFLKKCPKF